MINTIKKQETNEKNMRKTIKNKKLMRKILEKQ